MTREMYETLATTDLRAIAKQRGLKLPARARKSDIIDLMLDLDQQEARALAAPAKASAAPATAAVPATASVSATASASAAAPVRATTAASSTAPAEPEKASAVSASASDAPKQNAPVRRGPGRPRRQNNQKMEPTPADASENTAQESASETSAAQAPASETSAAPTSAAVSAASDGPQNAAPAGKDSGRNRKTPGRPRTKKKTVQKTEAPSADGKAVPAAETETAPIPEVQTKSEQAKSEQAKSEQAKSEQARSEQVKSASEESRVAEAAEETKTQSSNSYETAKASDAQVSEPQTVYERPVTAQGSVEVANRYSRRGLQRPDQPILHKNELNKELDSGEMAKGILEVMPDGFGFIRSANYLPGDNDIYVAPSQIRRFNLKTGDILEGNIRIKTQSEKFSALLFVKSVNGAGPETAKGRFNFEDMTPVFPDEKIRLEKPGCSVAMRVMDLMCPVGKGQRGMIVSPPKAGKTTLMKEVAKSVKYNNPEIHLIILLIDERPEEVTDIREALEGPNVEVIYSTFDETPEHHKRVAEMVIERAKRLVEMKQDVMILLDSITRLTRAYNLTEASSGRTLSGGLDPAALHMPKRFFGAARNMREGGSLTILATALVETGSKMDDVVYEEFKGTGNMEIILNRKLSERRIFPAIDLAKSGTRRDDLLLSPDEQECIGILRRAFIGNKGEEATNSVLDLFSRSRNNVEFVYMTKKLQWTF